MKILGKKTNKIKLNKASFLKKLYEILNEPSFYDYIRWSPYGLSFMIVNQKLFIKKVMSKYWTHDNFTSFHRQIICIILKK